MEPTIGGRIKFVAQMVEKFVEDNLIEKNQRDENLRKLALAFETIVKDNPIRQGFVKAEPAVKNVPVKIRRLENFKGELPRYQTSLASGVDVRAQLDESITLAPGQRVLLPTGLAVAIPAGYEIQVRPRSGWAIRDGISLVNTPGTIDADYRGEVKVIVINLGQADVVIRDQDRIAQWVLCPVVQAEWVDAESLDETDRGAGGFGSTGRG